MAGTDVGRKQQGSAALEHHFHQLKATDVDDLGLVGAALAGAKALHDAFPEVIFTSGRRDTDQQAKAMAGNVVQNRRWIAETYKPGPERAALQLWVNQHPEATTALLIAAGFRSVMASWTDAQKASLSSHFAGLAFDIHPVGGALGQRVKVAIRQLSGLRQFMQSEGGLVIWHADFLK